VPCVAYRTVYCSQCSGVTQTLDSITRLLCCALASHVRTCDVPLQRQARQPPSPHNTLPPPHCRSARLFSPPPPSSSHVICCARPLPAPQTNVRATYTTATDATSRIENYVVTSFQLIIQHAGDEVRANTLAHTIRSSNTAIASDYKRRGHNSPSLHPTPKLLYMPRSHGGRPGTESDYPAIHTENPAPYAVTATTLSPPRPRPLILSITTSRSATTYRGTEKKQQKDPCGLVAPRNYSPGQH
jgi:hypothetical protein